MFETSQIFYPFLSNCRSLPIRCWKNWIPCWGNVKKRLYHCLTIYWGNSRLSKTIWYNHKRFLSSRAGCMVVAWLTVTTKKCMTSYFSGKHWNHTMKKDCGWSNTFSITRLLFSAFRKKWKKILIIRSINSRSSENSSMLKDSSITMKKSLNWWTKM